MNPSNEAKPTEQPDEGRSLVPVNDKGRSFGLGHILNKQYKTLQSPSDKLQAMLGEEIGDPFSQLIYGLPKNGKTSYTLQLTKELAMIGKVFYNSAEEGDSLTFQQALERVKMDEIPKGNLIIGDRLDYKQLMAKLKTSKAKFVVIDSRDYMRLSTMQWIKLTITYKSKSFILICWEQSGKPAGKYAKDIEFTVGIVTHVKNFVAHSRGRFGIPKPYTIWAGAKRSMNAGLFG